jgi:gluconate/galactonate dehydratase
MKIIGLKSAVVEGNFDWTFVRVETDEGIRGLGESFFAPGLTSILRSLEPVIAGEDPRDINRLFRKLQLAVSGAGSVAGIVYNTISGIEAALWDVLGQWLDVPIYRLLGGKFRDSIRVYADCHGGEALESLDEVLRFRAPSWILQDSKHVTRDYFSVCDETPSSPEAYRKRALAMRSKGFTALKFDLDVPGTQRLDPYCRGRWLPEKTCTCSKDFVKFWPNMLSELQLLTCRKSEAMRWHCRLHSLPMDNP